ncbi:MAG: shikimate dehydrogenase [Sphingomicrobium sp.]
MPYAEVIGDPIAQSLSPAIHKFWLEQAGLAGDYRALRVRGEDLAAYLRDRRSDPDWRGCNVTIPHKEKLLVHLDEMEPRAAAIGAVNCVEAGAGRLIGHNTDLDGIAAALDCVVLEGCKAAVIGGGGAARAAAAYLAGRGVARIAILVRDPAKAEPLRALAGGASFEIGRIETAQALFDGAAVIINASPLGMAGCPPMPVELVAAAGRYADRALLFDMVYDPVTTPFLAAGQRAGGSTVDGLVMLIGQAKRAFETFFGQAPPNADAALRALLTT